MNLTASLTMYAWPEVHTSLDQFWQLFNEQLIQSGYTLPAKLDHNASESIWLDKHLGLSQTCGFPLNHILGDRVSILGTPNYTCDYVSDGMYASVILARHSDSRERLLDYRDSTVAINSLHSQSGYNTLRNLLVEQQGMGASLPAFFAKGQISNGHRQSIQAVASGVADICAVDPISFALAQQFEPAVSALKVIDSSPSTPGLPLICSPTLFNEAEQMASYKAAVQQAWRTAAADPVSEPLLLGDIVEIPRAAYSAVKRYELSLFANSI